MTLDPIVTRPVSFRTAWLRGLFSLRIACETGILQQLYPPLLRASERRRAERPVVVVNARTAQFDCLVVDPRATAGIHADGADAEGIVTASENPCTPSS